MKTDKKTIHERLDKPAFYKSLVSSLKDTGKDQALGLCPFHDDKHPSLSINLEDGLYNCFSCGAKGDVFTFYQELKKVDFPTTLQEIAAMQGITDTQVKQIVVATYEYTDVDGKILYSKERLEPGKNARNKDFKFRNHLTGKNERGCDPVLYNSQELITSKYALIAEGEGKADLLKTWGLVATCLDSGANSPWKDEYTKFFEGKEKIVFLPDNDTPGRSYASKIATALNGTVGSMKVVELPGLQEAEDVIDWSKKEGNDKERLLELIKEAPEWIPTEEPEAKEAEGFDPSKLPTGAALQKLVVMIEWLIKGLLPKKAITVLHGPGGIGKTWLSLLMAECISTGKAFLGLATEQTPVYYIDYENPLPVLVERVKTLNIQSIHFWHISNETPPPALDTEESYYYSKLPEGSLIIFDTFRSAHTGDENDSRNISGVLTVLKLLREKGYTILLLHHTAKGNDSRYKGSTAILDLADHELNLCNAEKKEGEDETYYKLHTPQKSRYQTEELTLDFDLDQGGFILMPDQTEGTLKQIHEVMTRLSEDQRKKTALVDQLKSELKLSQKKSRKLLDTGIGKFWTVTHAERNATFYHPIQFISLSPPYRELQTDKLNLPIPETVDKLDTENPQQTLVNIESGSLSGCIKQTEKLDLFEGVI